MYYNDTMSMAAQIRAKLERELSPNALKIIDDSAKHAGHAAAQPEGETHFTVEIISAAFTGLPRMARHRLIHDILKEELADSVHALSIKAYAPGE